MRRFAPSLSLSIPQGGSNRLDFFIQNIYNESLIIFYMIEKPSGVNINYYPPKYYNLEPGKEIAGNLNISIDPYLDSRIYTIKFWINSFEEFGNDTIRSNEFTINLNVTKKTSILNSTNLITTVTTKQTPGEVPIENITSAVTTEIPVINPPTWGENQNVSYDEYLKILGVICLLLVIPVLMLNKTSKGKSSTSSQEEVQV
jgi:hypothetical protein